MVLELEECVFACVRVCMCMCRVNTPEEREKMASIEFPPGPRLGQDEMNRELDVGKDGEKDGGEEGAHEEVSKRGREKRGGCGNYHAAYGLGFTLIHLSVRFVLGHAVTTDLHTHKHTHKHTRTLMGAHAHMHMFRHGYVKL